MVNTLRNFDRISYNLKYISALRSYRKAKTIYLPEKKKVEVTLYAADAIRDGDVTMMNEYMNLYYV